MKFRYFLTVLFSLLVITPAKAELQIDVNGAVRDPMPIAIPEMIHEGFWIGQPTRKQNPRCDCCRLGALRLV